MEVKLSQTAILFFALYTFIFPQPKLNSTSAEIQYKKILKDPNSNPKFTLEALTNLLMLGESSLELKQKTKQILENPKSPKDLLIKALEISHAFFKYEFITEIEKIYYSNSENYIQALSRLYLLNNNYEFLDQTFENLNFSNTTFDPPLQDILKWSPPKSWIFYSIHPRNREYAGILIIKTPQGKFLRNLNGNIFHIPQFARAITNLPYFFFNGHTPSGIYKLGKPTFSKNLSIGKTPTIPIYLPFEISKQAFLGKKGNWELQDIKNLFPNSWWENEEIYESFYAGKLGRSQIAMHGSKVNPKNFELTSFYPFQPAVGCITTLELWEDETLKFSYQIELLKQIEKEEMNGFVYVINRNFERRILLEDIIFDILGVEATLP